MACAGPRIPRRPWSSTAWSWLQRQKSNSIHQKHSGLFPANAIRFCLAEGGINLHAMNCIAHCFDYEPYAAAYALGRESVGDLPDGLL